jgi:hypothetical protein
MGTAGRIPSSAGIAAVLGAGILIVAGDGDVPAGSRGGVAGIGGAGIEIIAAHRKFKLDSTSGNKYCVNPSGLKSRVKSNYQPVEEKVRTPRGERSGSRDAMLLVMDRIIGRVERSFGRSRREVERRGRVRDDPCHFSSRLPPAVPDSSPSTGSGGGGGIPPLLHDPTLLNPYPRCRRRVSPVLLSRKFLETRDPLAPQGDSSCSRIRMRGKRASCAPAFSNGIESSGLSQERERNTEFARGIGARRTISGAVRHHH